MYIKKMSDQNKNYYISIWLLLITFLVGLMIIVGGLTRLTDSGLSITKWDLVSGTLPPFTLKDWEELFLLYKQIPEFILINSTMTLEEFKFIFWWEYAHRLLGRLIGLGFIIPLIYFTIKKYTNFKYLINFYVIFLLISFQGFIGWYMVKSGLTERTDVSHYRLSIHLTLAFIILSLLFINFLKFKDIKKNNDVKRIPFYILEIFIFFVLLQIALGGFVSGLDAGQIYQTWPLMNESYFPNDSIIKDYLKIDFLDSASLVQFLHRNLAYFILFYFMVVAFKIFNNSSYKSLRKYVFLVFLALFLQIFLGILTILSGAQILLASMHQIGSIILILTSLTLAFKNSRFN